MFFLFRLLARETSRVYVSYQHKWPCGVMVSTLDSESSDPSSNLGRTSIVFKWGILTARFDFVIIRGKLPAFLLKHIER